MKQKLTLTFTTALLVCLASAAYGQSKGKSRGNMETCPTTRNKEIKVTREYSGGGGVRIGVAHGEAGAKTTRQERWCEPIDLNTKHAPDSPKKEVNTNASDFWTRVWESPGRKLRGET